MTHPEQPAHNQFSDLRLIPAEFVQRLERIESLLYQLLSQRQIKKWYSTSEVAEKVGRAEFKYSWISFQANSS